MALHSLYRLTHPRHPPQAKPASSCSFFFSSPPTRGSLMAGGRTLEVSVSPADAGSPGANPEVPGRRQQQRRRRSVSGSYAELAALLPGVSSRASQVEVVEAAAAHVKVLQDTAAVLEAYRAVQRGRGGGGGTTAVVEVASREAVCFAVHLPAAAVARAGALTRVLEAFHRHGVEVLAATMTRGGVGGDGEAAARVTVTAAAAAPEVVESINADIAVVE